MQREFGDIWDVIPLFAVDVPAGVLETLSTFAVYTITLAYLGIGLGQARTAAIVILFAVTLWVLTILARPLNPRRCLLIGAMAVAFKPSCRCRG